jgi:hypothetical protein
MIQGIWAARSFREFSTFLCHFLLNTPRGDGLRNLPPKKWLISSKLFSSANAMIRKLASGKYRLYSRKRNPKTGRRRNLGTFSTRTAAEKHERAVQFYKRHWRPVEFADDAGGKLVIAYLGGMPHAFKVSPDHAADESWEQARRLTPCRKHEACRACDPFVRSHV